MADRSDDNDAPGRLPAWRLALSFRDPLYRLARPVCRRLAARVSNPVHPGLGPRIPVLADAHGAFRRGAPVARLGIADRPARYFIAGGGAQVEHTRWTELFKYPR